MEERLFWIGSVVGLYAWFTRYGMRAGKLDSKTATSIWHGVFCAMAGFAGTLVMVMYMEDRARFQSVTVGILSPRELYYSVIGGSFFGLWGGLSAWRKGRSKEARTYYHAEDLEWAETVFSAVLLAAFMMYFVVQAFKIPSGSMRVTLLEGDHLFVNKFIYGVRIPFTHQRIFRLRPVHRQDVIVFRFPTDDPQSQHCGSVQYGKDFIKRVIGLPGERVQVIAGKVYINGTLLDPEPYTQYLDVYRQEKYPVSVSPEQYQQYWADHELDQRIGDNVVRDYFGPVTVPPNSYFVMGDNRDRSCDARFWGPVPDYYLKGKAWLIYWPPSRIRAVN